MTNAEQRLWKALRKNQLGVKFRKQHPIGKYVVDFISLEAKLIIELDGGQHNEASAIQCDELRTQFLQDQGFQVVRFWNNDVLQNTESVLEKISIILRECAPCRPHPNPPPTGEGEERA